MFEQDKYKLKRRNHGDFPDNNGPVSIEAANGPGYFSAIVITVHDEGVPNYIVTWHK
jgi:hypothetical protein